MEDYKLILTFFILLFLIFSLITFIEAITEKIINTKEVPCYDGYRNKIKGVECKKEIRCGVISELLGCGK